MNADAIVRLLAEPERLRVLSALVLGARTHRDVAAVADLDARTAVRALRRLQSAGLIDDELAVRADLIRDAARSAAPPATPPDGHGYADPAVEQIVSRFVRDGRLVSLPASESRRRTVLEHVVQSFEPGRRYPERDVDAVLRAWTGGGTPDHATLRRHLVDHQLLAREHGEYWRCGGWTDTLGSPAHG